MLGTVHELVGNEKFTGAKVFFERADCADRHDALDAKKLHRVNVGSIVDFGWQNAVAARVAGEEGDPLPFQRSDNDGIRRIAERRFHSDFARVGQTLHCVQPAAADDPDCGVRFAVRFFCALRLLSPTFAFSL